MAGPPAFPNQQGNAPPMNNPETPVGLGLSSFVGTPTPQQLLAMQNLSRTPGTTPYVGFFGPAGGPMIGTGTSGAPPPVPQYFFTSNQPPLNAAAAVALASPARRPGGRPRNPPQASSTKRHCNCKNSRCLKLYCECFASGRYCDGCNCVGCFNNQANEGTRQAAVEAILDRNPNAFRPKIAGDLGEEGGAVGAARHNKGCNCKKSGCLKKYCECFQAGIFCSGNCKCVDCKNYEGSEARAAAVSPGMPPHLTLRDAAGTRETPHMSPPASLQRGVAIGGAAPPARLPPGGAFGVGSSPQSAAGEPGPAYHRPPVGSPMRPPPGMPLPPLFMQQFGAVGPIPAPSPQAPALTIPRTQRAAALREALKEAVKPEVVEKVCQLLLISAGEAQREEAQRDGEGDVHMAEEAPSTSGDAPRDKEEDTWVPSAVYADQERRVLQEFRDSLQMLCRLVQGKSERKLRDALANNALVAMLSQAAATTGMQPQLRPVVPSTLGQNVSAGGPQGPSPAVTSQGGNPGNEDEQTRVP